MQQVEIKARLFLSGTTVHRCSRCIVALQALQHGTTFKEVFGQISEGTTYALAAFKVLVSSWLNCGTCDQAGRLEIVKYQLYM